MSSPESRSDLLIRVRERLAAESADPTPQVMADAVRAESGGVLGDTDLLEALRFLQTELVGAGRLEHLLADPDVADILVVGPDQVWVDRGRGLVPSAVRFDDDAAVRRLAVRLALGAGKRLDDAAPWVDGQLSNVGRRGYSVRLHAVIPPISVDGTCLSLRVLRPATQHLGALVERGAVPPEIAELVEAIVAARLAFLVVGGTGAGKTTLLSAMLGRVDPAERILVVEDAAELAPAHPHVVRLVARTANVEGAGAVAVRDLVRQALRMRPDRIVVGEVRGPEVVDLLTALNTGHEGCAGTLHANSGAEVPARMEALAALGGMDRTALHSQLAAAVHVVVVVARDADGHRGVAEIGMVDRGTDGWVHIEPVWRRDSGFGPAADRLHTVMAQRRTGIAR
ncbi:TadA family conjugal transfer-associated ATPase [Williamsia herbipolensis]|uniref:TadA family conjugal transfer-associated ATPase n=1 Tax=Williamsia herbipolensis TaxID=1603258 RepID=A0AAU4JZA6_9NOCA|nr:TadA family conjugal transfer-associated ATPase [Williamsia herbipolensis]